VSVPFYIIYTRNSLLSKIQQNCHPNQFYADGTVHIKLAVFAGLWWIVNAILLAFPRRVAAAQVMQYSTKAGPQQYFVQ